MTICDPYINYFYRPYNKQFNDYMFMVTSISLWPHWFLLVSAGPQSYKRLFDSALQSHEGHNFLYIRLGLTRYTGMDSVSMKLHFIQSRGSSLLSPVSINCITDPGTLLGIRSCVLLWLVRRKIAVIIKLLLGPQLCMRTGKAVT